MVAFAALASAAKVARWILELLIGRWLDTRFKERLERLRQEHAKEVARLNGDLAQEATRLKSSLDKDVEHVKGAIVRELELLKGRINAQADRRLRLHQYEFDTLPELWTLLDRAYNRVARSVASLDQFPDFSLMNHDALVRYAQARNYSPDQLERFLKKPDRDTAAKINKLIRDNAAGKAQWKLRSFNRRNGIFWPDDIQAEVATIVDEMGKILIYGGDRADLPDPIRTEFYRLLALYTDNDRKRLNQVRALIKDRLNANVLAEESAIVEDALTRAPSA